MNCPFTVAVASASLCNLFFLSRSAIFNENEFFIHKNQKKKILYILWFSFLCMCCICSEMMNRKSTIFTTGSANPAFRSFIHLYMCVFRKKNIRELLCFHSMRCRCALCGSCFCTISFCNQSSFLCHIFRILTYKTCTTVHVDCVSNEHSWMRNDSKILKLISNCKAIVQKHQTV